MCCCKVNIVPSKILMNLKLDQVILKSILKINIKLYF